MYDFADSVRGVMKLIGDPWSYIAQAKPHLDKMVLILLKTNMTYLNSTSHFLSYMHKPVLLFTFFFKSTIIFR